MSSNFLYKQGNNFDNSAIVDTSYALQRQTCLNDIRRSKMSCRDDFCLIIFCDVCAKSKELA